MIKGTYIKNSISFALLAVMMCFLFIWNINSGSVHLSVEEIGEILFRRTGRPLHTALYGIYAFLVFYRP